MRIAYSLLYGHLSSCQSTPTAFPTFHSADGQHATGSGRTFPVLGPCVALSSPPLPVSTTDRKGRRKGDAAEGATSPRRGQAKEGTTIPRNLTSSPGFPRDINASPIVLAEPPRYYPHAQSGKPMSTTRARHAAPSRTDAQCKQTHLPPWLPLAHARIVCRTLPSPPLFALGSTPAPAPAEGGTDHAMACLTSLCSNDNELVSTWLRYRCYADTRTRQKGNQKCPCSSVRRRRRRPSQPHRTDKVWTRGTGTLAWPAANMQRSQAYRGTAIKHGRLNNTKPSPSVQTRLGQRQTRLPNPNP